jgi:hypothetical protein
MDVMRIAGIENAKTLPLIGTDDTDRPERQNLETPKKLKRGGN